MQPANMQQDDRTHKKDYKYEFVNWTAVGEIKDLGAGVFLRGMFGDLPTHSVHQEIMIPIKYKFKINYQPDQGKPDIKTAKIKVQFPLVLYVEYEILAVGNESCIFGFSPKIKMSASAINAWVNGKPVPRDSVKSLITRTINLKVTPMQEQNAHPYLKLVYEWQDRAKSNRGEIVPYEDEGEVHFYGNGPVVVTKQEKTAKIEPGLAKALAKALNQNAIQGVAIGNASEVLCTYSFEKFFADVPRDHRARKYLMDFAKKTQVDDSIVFLDEVEDFKLNPTREKLEKIFAIHILPGAVLQINIPGHIAKNLEASRVKFDTLSAGERAQIFDTAKSHIFAMINRDAYPDFQKWYIEHGL